MKKETLLLISLAALILWPWLAVFLVGELGLKGGYFALWCAQAGIVEFVLLTIFFAFIKAVADMEKEKESKE